MENHPLNPFPERKFIANEGNLPAASIAYGILNEKADFYIPAQQLFFDSKRVVDVQDIDANQYQYAASTIYSVEERSKQPADLLINTHFQFDIFETIFFHISRYEEVHCNESDNNDCGWLQEEKQFLIRHQLEKLPVVDQLVVAFFEVIFQTKIQQATTFDLSHDLDMLYRFKPFYKFIRSLGATILLRRDIDQIRRSIKHYWSMLSGQMNDPYDTYHWLFRKEDVFTSKRLFLMAGGNSKYDNHYRIESKSIKTIIELAQDKVYEIGLHPSYNAGFNNEMYTQEKRKLEGILNHSVKHNRQHWLRWNWKITPYILSHNQIEIDATMGFNGRLGFRCGTGFAFHLYDFTEEVAFPWREQPFSLMESSAIHESRDTGKDIMAIMHAFLEINKDNTHISVNFHNSNFDPTLQVGRALSHFYESFVRQLTG